MRLNYNQGLGFVVAGTHFRHTTAHIILRRVASRAGVVVDKKTLRNALITIAGSMSTAITALLALSRSVATQDL